MKRAIVLLSLVFYGVLAFGANVFGSYRYEPSGVQYVFLPFLAAPMAAAIAFGLLVVGRRAGLSLTVLLIPFLAVAVLILPGVGMRLSNRNLEVARWVLILLGATHAAAVTWHLRLLREKQI